MHYSKMHATHAEMVKLVDTQVSGTCGGNPVEVRVLFSAQSIASQKICFIRAATGRRASQVLQDIKGIRKYRDARLPVAARIAPSFTQ